MTFSIHLILLGKRKPKVYTSSRAAKIHGPASLRSIGIIFSRSMIVSIRRQTLYVSIYHHLHSAQQNTSALAAITGGETPPHHSLVVKNYVSFPLFPPEPYCTIFRRRLELSHPYRCLFKENMSPSGCFRGCSSLRGTLAVRLTADQHVSESSLCLLLATQLAGSIRANQHTHSPTLRRGETRGFPVVFILLLRVFLRPFGIYE